MKSSFVKNIIHKYMLKWGCNGGIYVKCHVKICENICRVRNFVFGFHVKIQKLFGSNYVLIMGNLADITRGIVKALFFIR